jgi:hypothetical protein
MTETERKFLEVQRQRVSFDFESGMMATRCRMVSTDDCCERLFHCASLTPLTACGKGGQKRDIDA